VKHRQVKLILWGCFWGNQRGPLVPLVNGTSTAVVYRELLRRWLLPVLEDVRTALGNPLFQQDNAKIHTAKLVNSFFKLYASVSSLTHRTPLTLIQSIVLGFYLNNNSELVS